MSITHPRQINGTTTPELAAQFLELFSDERRWTSPALALDAQGRWVMGEDPFAVCWCSMGALYATQQLVDAHARFVPGAINSFYFDWTRKAQEMYGPGASIPAVNDQIGLDAVRKVLRALAGETREIELLEPPIALPEPVVWNQSLIEELVPCP